MKCPYCNAECESSDDICRQCCAIINPSPKLLHTVKKHKFKLDKRRSEFPSEVTKHISKDDIILADTYGIDEYYLVTTQHVYICEIFTRGGWLKPWSQELGGLKHAISFDRVTSITGWSALWWENEDVIMQPAMHNLKIETFDGDHRVIAVVSNSVNSVKQFMVKDSQFFQRKLAEAYTAHENSELLYPYVLYNAELKGTPEVPTANHLAEPVSGSGSVEVVPAALDNPKKSKTINVKCKCGKEFAVPIEFAGKAGRCPSCSAAIRIPDSL